METQRITVTGARKQVGTGDHARTLWSNVDLGVAAGEVVCLTGPSGCGKSTFLNCLGLLDTFDGGSLDINGRDVTRASARAKGRLRRHTIGYLFQDYALIDNQSIRSNVALAVNARRGKDRTITAALAAVGLEGREKETVFKLSGGEQQRVAMARVIARSPEIVLADEPTASLDRTNASLILGHLSALAADGAAVVIVSHDPWVVEQCDREVRLAA